MGWGEDLEELSRSLLRHLEARYPSFSSDHEEIIAETKLDVISYLEKTKLFSSEIGEERRAEFSGLVWKIFHCRLNDYLRARYKAAATYEERALSELAADPQESQGFLRAVIALIVTEMQDMEKADRDLLCIGLGKSLRARNWHQELRDTGLADDFQIQSVSEELEALSNADRTRLHRLRKKLLARVAEKVGLDPSSFLFKEGE